MYMISSAGQKQYMDWKKDSDLGFWEAWGVDFSEFGL